MHVDFQDRLADFDRANLVALQHIDLVDPWVVQHKTSIEKTYNDRGRQWMDGDVLKEHYSCFTRWFKDKLCKARYAVLFEIRTFPPEPEDEAHIGPTATYDGVIYPGFQHDITTLQIQGYNISYNRHTIA